MAEKQHLANSILKLSSEVRNDIQGFISLIQKQVELVGFAGVLSGIQIPYKL